MSLEFVFKNLGHVRSLEEILLASRRIWATLYLDNVCVCVFMNAVHDVWCLDGCLGVLLWFKCVVFCRQMCVEVLD